MQHYKEDIVYQKIPTFRVHLCDNKAVCYYHKDKEFNHRESEINFYLPLTRANENNTIWAERIPDSKIYSPINAEYGEIVLWDGANLMHGNKLNDTGQTRVSVDFRVVPLNKFDDSKSLTSYTHKVKMDIGNYFDVILPKLFSNTICQSPKSIFTRYISC